MEDVYDQITAKLSRVLFAIATRLVLLLHTLHVGSFWVPRRHLQVWREDHAP